VEHRVTTGKGSGLFVIEDFKNDHRILGQYNPQSPREQIRNKDCGYNIIVDRWAEEWMTGKFNLSLVQPKLQTNLRGC
jgi:hypothetical protein